MKRVWEKYFNLFCEFCCSTVYPMSKSKKNRRVLVTGGAGAIGINLVRRLVAEGYGVTVFSLPAKDLFRLEDIERDVELVKGDITNAEQVRDVVSRLKPHYVFHLASTTMAVSPVRHMEVNAIGTINLLEALVETKPERFVYTGSAAVYGSGNSLREDAEFSPNTIFGAAKASTSIIVRTYADMYKLPTVELRFFLPYGPWEHPNRLIPHIILSALSGQDLPLTSGEQERDPTYIDDVIDALILAATNPVTPGSIFNIGSGEAVTVRHIVEKTLELMGNPVKPEFGKVPTRENEIMHMSADIRAAREGLGWEPKHSLADGLQKTINWWKQNRDFADYMTKDGEMTGKKT
ncbi:MAG: nucleoside-diphosphate-sugar epimerase [Parcubacteria group bacterium Gr01-1014_70]|nr:MAG: nucleoside-diphosphate-sugar epimerase [Parcubacteria group bacterium Gr01-1014_70]